MFDTIFLQQLNEHRHKETFVKIISLTMDEEPLEQIEGKVTGGSINIDGKSAVRRTCSLTFIAKDVNINNFYWSVSNKFTLEIGVKNTINSNYPEIIWFKQGVFVITSFSSTLTQNNFSISISGKDKMCLLNGDMGGNLPASIDFGKMDTYTKEYSKIEFADHTTYEAAKYYIYDTNLNEYRLSMAEYDADEVYYTQDTLLNQESLKLRDIIREAVHVYGKEPYHNIIINNIEDYGLELLQYRGDEAFYLLYSEDEGIYDQMVSQKEIKRLLLDSPEFVETFGNISFENDSRPLSEILEGTGFQFNNAVDEK